MISIRLDQLNKFPLFFFDLFFANNITPLGIKRRHQDILSELESERKQLTDRADMAEAKILEYKEMEFQQNSVIEAMKRSAELEKCLMTEKLDQLEMRVREQQALVHKRQSSNDHQHSSSHHEETSYEQQIDFLNSVIVDMQRKNDELRNRVQVLEEIGLLLFLFFFVFRFFRSNNNLFLWL